MDSYKNYLYRMRMMAFEEPYLILGESVAPKLIYYYSLVTDVKFEDSSYHTYFDEIKNIVASFALYWAEIMGNSMKEADYLINNPNRDELMELGDKTIFSHCAMQTEFGKKFLPANNVKDKEAYENVQREFDIYIEKLNEIRDQINGLDKQEKIHDFVSDHVALSMARKQKYFEFTHNSISNYLSANCEKIHISLEENMKRIARNLKEIETQTSEDLNELHHTLYEKNKEYLCLLRSYRRPSVDLAEVEKSVEVIKDKIRNIDCFTVDHLKEEWGYWKSQLKEFEKIEKTLVRLKEEEAKLSEQQNIYESMKDSEMPSPKRPCWSDLPKQFQEKWDRLNKLKLNASKAVFTFFSVRDHTGAYDVDEYDHQVFNLDHDLEVHHVNCNGKLVNVSREDKYYYDDYGRYIMKNGEKFYQAAPCRSTYKLKDDIFVKQTKDCGHSDAYNQECRMTKSQHDKVMLPLIETIDIKGKLDPETVDYLWSSMGHILPAALMDVAELQPKNPIHVLAHKILQHKYNRTQHELEKAKTEALLFKEKFSQERKDKELSAYNAWKAKQVKPRKPEESDDLWERSFYDAYKKEEQFILSFNVENN